MNCCLFYAEITRDRITENFKLRCEKGENNKKNSDKTNRKKCNAGSFAFYFVFIKPFRFIDKNKGGEIGIHGYNHQPLALEGFEYADENKDYVSWPSLKKIVESIKTVIDYTEGLADDLYVQAYIAPSNVISSDVLNELQNQFAKESNGAIGLSDAYYGLKSMLLPLYFLLRQEVPEADLYHSAVTGYGGILGAVAKHKSAKPFVLTEHGIYPREREEELLQADWVTPSLRDTWINMFYNLSRCAYHYADKVTALFKTAMEKQVEIGCERSKCSVVANGIHY